MVDFCLHLANILYLGSFLGRDMLKLRILTCAGLSLGVVFFTCQKTPLYGPTSWHLAFLAINTVQIWRLVLERRRLQLTGKQERVGEASFRDLSREELLTLLTHAMAGHVPEGPSDIRQASRQPLTRQEAVFQDIAFSHLSRDELLNLLTRKLWTSIVRLDPARQKRA